MNNNTDYLINNKRFISLLLDEIFKLIDIYSISVASSLKTSWKNYTDEKNSLTKKNRSLDKLLKKIEQLKLIEQKKINYKINKDKIINLVENIKVITQKNKKIYVKIISCSIYYSDIIKNILDLYMLNEKEIAKIINMKEKLILNNNKSKKVKIRSYIDNNGKLYLNLILRNNILAIDMKSLENERKVFENAINNNKNFDVWKDFNYEISPFEKKRRNYILGMFSLKSSLINLKEKTIDITYPVERCFEFAKIILDNLYKELMFWRSNSIYDNLYEKTIETYGVRNIMALYDEVILRIENYVGDEYVKEELVRTSLVCKKKSQFIEFKDINGIVPKIDDIIRILNNRIIDGIKRNQKEYLLDISKRVKKVTDLMDLNEIVAFYNEFREILFRSYLNSKSVIKNYEILRKTLIDIIFNKYKIDKDVIIRDYLSDV